MISPIHSKPCAFGSMYIKSDVREKLETLPLDKIREVKDCANRLSNTNEWNAVLSKDSVEIFSNSGLKIRSPFAIKRDKVRPYLLHVGDEKNFVPSDIFGNKVFDFDSKHLEIMLDKDINSSTTSRLLIALEALNPLKQATEIISYLENKNGLFDKYVKPSPERQHVEKIVVKQLANDLFEKHGIE